VVGIDARYESRLSFALFISFFFAKNLMSCLCFNFLTYKALLVYLKKCFVIYSSYEVEGEQPEEGLLCWPGTERKPRPTVRE